MNLNEAAVITSLADAYKLEPALAGALIEIESNGDALTQVGRKLLPVIRWEGHYFDKYVPAKLQAAAREAGLASPIAGKIKNPASQSGRYDLLYRAMALDEAAALRSISIGIGQVMGAHAERLGFDNPKHMFDTACLGFTAQADQMLRYVVAFGLLDELQAHDFAGFARGYNGANYARYGYDKKLAAAYTRLSGKIPQVKDSGMLRLGSKGPAVRELQQLLVRAGYALKVDGDFGPSTKTAVMQFQTARQITVDGLCGPETMAQLMEYRKADEKLAVPDLKKVTDSLVAGLGGSAGAAAAKVQVEAVAKEVKNLGFGWFFDGLANGLFGLAAVLAVAGLGLAAYQWYKARQS